MRSSLLHRLGWPLPALLLVATASAGPADPGRTLTRAIEVRSLPPDQAQLALPVHLRGTVTFIDENNAVCIQDDSAGTFFRPQPPGIRLGDQVEIRGTTQPGLYLPGVDTLPDDPGAFRLIAHAALPAPIPARYQDLVSGRYHYQRVAIEGVVRSVEPYRHSPTDGAGLLAQPRHAPRATMRLFVDGRSVEVRVQDDLAAPPTPPAIDSRVRVVGLVAGNINSRRQLVRPYLRMLSWSDVTVLEPAIDETATPRISASELLTFHVAGSSDHRVRVSGTVTASISPHLAYLRSGTSAFSVHFLQPTPVAPGERIEILGFPEMDRYSALVADAKLLGRRPDQPPVPVALSIQETYSGSHSGDLVTVEGRVTDSFRTENGSTLTIQHDGRALQVRGPTSPQPVPLGSLIRVVGICQVESINRRGYIAQPDAVIIHTRSPDDIQLLQLPSGWTVRRLATLLAVLVAVIIVAALWITLLRRQVARQTEILRASIGSAAALEERQRIAREFHDSLEQDLAGLNLRLDAVATRALDDKGRRLLDASRSLVGRIQSETRSLISDLRSPAEAAGDLGGALQDLVARHRDQPGIAVAATVTDPPPRLPARTVHHLRMIAAEGVTNALKHAQASAITLTLGREENRLLLRIRDNGRGFDPERDTHGRTGRFGCIGIRERSRLLGAEAVWRSHPGAGTELAIILPLAEFPPAPA